MFNHVRVRLITSVVSSTLRPHGPQPAACPWDFPGKNTGMGCHPLLQGIVLTQGLNWCFLCLLLCRQILALPTGSDGKESACSAGDLGSIPGLGQSPGERHGIPLQYSRLENPMDRGPQQATVHGVAKTWTRLSHFTFTLDKIYHFNYTEV